MWKYLSNGPELPRNMWFILYTRSHSFSVRFQLPSATMDKIGKSNHTWLAIWHHEKSIKEDLQWCVKANSNKITCIIKAEEAFISEQINHLFFQNSYHQNELHLENEYNSFRDTSNQLSIDQDHDTYYTRANYHNYQQKPNPMNRPYQCNTCPRISPTFNRQQHNRRGKNPYDRNDIQLWCNICESIYHMAQNCPEKCDLYYTKEVILFQLDFNHPLVPLAKLNKM